MYLGHCIRAHHAEANALMQAAKLGIPVRGAILYCTHRPCIHCIKLIVQAGITSIIYTHDYVTDQSYDFVYKTARAAGITMDRWEEVLA